MERVYEIDWDVLIILDACRYDRFEFMLAMYGNLEGVLTKVFSPASETFGFLNRTFNHCPSFWGDTTYISGHPYVNSKLPMKKYGKTFDAAAIFYKIIDVWDFGWDETCNYLPPKSINDAYFSAPKRLKSMKFILHYLQPHVPFVALSRKGIKMFKIHEDYMDERGINKWLRGLVGEVNWYKLLDIFGIRFTNHHDFVTRLSGIDELKRCYDDNLRIVLEEGVIPLLTELSGKKVIITSDHGELLGEHGRIGHLRDSNYSELREVPWLEMSL